MSYFVIALSFAAAWSVLTSVGHEQECTLSVHFILIRVLCHRFLMSLFSVCRSERLVTPVKETASVHAMKMAILRSTMSAR